MKPELKPLSLTNIFYCLQTKLKYVIKCLRFIYATNICCMPPLDKAYPGSEDAVMNKTEMALPSFRCSKFSGGEREPTSNSTQTHIVKTLHCSSERYLKGEV